jgi:Skp family chaperone for outer membrane proteins
MAGGTHAQPPGGGAAPPPGGQPPAAQQARPTIAVFNMAAVMRDYGKAKYQVYLLNEKRKGMSAELIKYRDAYIKCQQDGQKAADPKVKEGLSNQMLDLARKIEDEDRKINKMLNDDASKIISDLYDDIKKVVDATAEMNGYHVVFAYPDAVTDEEKKNPFLKELKLKPPAAQPFYVARHVDLTGIVIQTLNAWNPAPPVPAEQPQPQPQPGPGGAPPNPVNSGVPSTVQPGATPGTVPGGVRPPGM